MKNGRLAAKETCHHSGVGLFAFLPREGCSMSVFNEVPAHWNTKCTGTGKPPDCKQRIKA